MATYTTERCFGCGEKKTVFANCKLCQSCVQRKRRGQLSELEIKERENTGTVGSNGKKPFIPYPPKKADPITTQSSLIQAEKPQPTTVASVTVPVGLIPGLGEFIAQTAASDLRTPEMQAMFILREAARITTFIQEA